MNLNECKAIITGGSKGIGFAVAKAVGAAGGQVAITARDASMLQGAARQIGAVAILGDVRNQEDCRRAVETAYEKLGGLNVLVNNAASGYRSPLESIEDERFLDLLNTNVLGPVRMAREAVRIFKRQEYGSIVNISSTSGLRGSENSSAYVASKFALRGMTQCWQAELRRHNIRVILVNPSEVQTGFGSKTAPSMPNPKKLLAEDIAHTVVACLTLNDRGFVPEVTVYATNPW